MHAKTIMAGVAAWLAAASPARPDGDPVVVAESPSRIDVAVRDCPLAEMLRKLCRILGCDLHMEPVPDERVTLTLIDRDIAFVLDRALGKSGYVITWQDDAKSIESIAVFRSEARDRGDSGRTAPVPEATSARRSDIRALSNLGTAPAANTLLERLGQSGGKEAAEVRDGIRNIVGTPTSLTALRNAAAGGPRFASEPVRVAAIQALSRFRDRPTLDLLKKLASDSSDAVRQASAAALAGDGGEDDDDGGEDDDGDDS